MTVTGDGADDEGTRVDREPPSFPTVGESWPGTSPQAASAEPLFSSSVKNGGVETSAIVSTPLDPPQGNRGGRLRWLAAGMATLLVFVVIGGVLFLSAPRGGAASAVAHYAPADTPSYVELRLDLPGDQLANLAAFMSHFPGFADRAAFQQKLDETLNSLLTNKTNGKLDWNNDVKPWFGGQVAAFGDLGASQVPVPMPACPAASATAICSQIGSDVAGKPRDGVVVFTVTDKVKLQSVIDANAGGSQVTTQDYQGNTIQTIAQPAGTSTAFSYVVTDDALLVSHDADQLKQALDVKAGQKSSLADDSFFLQQLGALHSDRLATFYYDASKQAMPAAVPSSSLLPTQCKQTMQSATKVKAVGEMRAETDHLALNIRTQLPSGDGAPPAPANRQTTLAQQMPGDAVAYFETHALGDTLGWGIKNMLGCMGAVSGGSGPLPSAFGGSDPSQLLQTLLGAKPEDYFDFIDDAALGVTYTNDKLGAGIVASVNDQATATARVNKLTGLLALAGMGGSGTGTKISSEQIDHNGTKVTVIHLPQGSGSPADAPQTLEIAVANNHLYLGIDDFVTSALDRSAADSLASNAVYQQAISGGPAENAGVAYVDMAAAVSAYGEILPTSSAQNFDTNVKPFLAPLKSLSFVSHVDGGMLISNGFLFVE